MDHDVIFFFHPAHFLKQKQTTEAVGNDTEIQIQDSPDKCRKRKRKIRSRVSTMKRQKVDRETSDVTSVLKSGSKAEEKVHFKFNVVIGF